MKKLHDHFFYHLRSYRTFYFMFFTFFLLVTSIVIHTFSNKIYAKDLLEKAFEPAITNETIINLWAGKNAVGNEVLRESIVINNLSSITTEAPLIVRIAKFLLRITMVLAITMVLFNGVMWIIESSKWAEVKNAKKNLILIVTGILIALMSLSIINLISSITVSSLGWSSTTIWNPSNNSTTDNIHRDTLENNGI